jgi:hypothetical protein
LRGSHVDHVGAVHVPQIGAGPSLVIIIGVLGAAVVASLARHRRTPPAGA